MYTMKSNNGKEYEKEEKESEEKKKGDRKRKLFMHFIIILA